MRSYSCLSFVINNNCPGNLVDLIESIAHQSSVFSRTIEIIIMDSNNCRNKEILSKINGKYKKLITKIDVMANHDYFPFDRLIKKKINSEIIFFTDSRYIPQPQWLESFLTRFADHNCNFLVGKIEENIDFKTEEYVEKWQYLRGNFALKKEYLQQLNICYTTEIREKDRVWLGRIMRELEAEIVFCAQSIVIKNS